MRQLVFALIIAGAMGSTVMAWEGDQTDREEDRHANQQQLQPLSPNERRELLDAREAVWRAWFNNDRDALEVAIPPDLVALGWERESWDNREAVLSQAAEFAAARGRLIELRFPRTEFQTYGDVAILYTRYEVTFENDGVIVTQSGRATEVFVRRHDRWINPGWHLDPGS